MKEIGIVYFASGSPAVLCEKDRIRYVVFKDGNKQRLSDVYDRVWKIKIENVVIDGGYNIKGDVFK